MDWCVEGPATYLQRKELFARRRAAVEQEMAQLQKTLDMLNYKCWYYDTAIAQGGEEGIQAMLPDKLPPEVQKLYDSSRDTNQP